MLNLTRELEHQRTLPRTTYWVLPQVIGAVVGRRLDGSGSERLGVSSRRIGNA